MKKFSVTKSQLSALGLATFLCLALVSCFGLVAAHAQSGLQDVERLETVDEQQKAKAKNIAIRLLESWRDGRFSALSDEFTSQMRKVMTPEFQEKTQTIIRGVFGDFQSLAFVEVVRLESLPDLILYRFRGTFSGTGKKPEVRVVFDKNGKIAGFAVKRWKEAIL